MDPIVTYPRYSLEADCLASQTEVPEGPLECECGRKWPAAGLFDASEYDDLEGDWRCIICFSAIDREETLARELAEAPAPSWAKTCQHGNAIRAERWQRLNVCDWTDLPSAPLSEEAKADWQAYRQALRDLTTDYASPDDVIWPTPPS